MPNCLIDVTVALGERGLEVAYSVTNQGDADIFLLDRLWQFSPEGQLLGDPHSAYVSLAADGTLRLGRILHPLPREMFVEQRLVPFATRVRKGTNHKDGFVLALPAREYNPYYPEAQTSEWKTASATSVEVYLSWLPDVQDMRAEPTPLADAVRLWHPRLMALVQTYRSDRIPLRVEVMKRTDKFERF